MPIYTFKNANGTLLSKRLSFSDYDSVVSGALKLVSESGEELQIVFDPGSVGFVMKDGVSGGWASKSMKENKIRAERTEVMKRKEKDHVFKSRLVPNYKGEEAHSWGDVRDHVRTEKGAAAASTYDHLVTK